FGYPDGTIPLDITLDMVGRIVEAAGDVPVSADLDNGYDDPGETTRRAIGVGIVGANVEDRLLPVTEAAERVAAVVAAGEAEGVPFALNARTDAFVRGGDKPVAEKVADAIERGRAYPDAGADTTFVPGGLDAAVPRAPTPSCAGATSPSRRRSPARSSVAGPTSTRARTSSSSRACSTRTSRASSSRGSASARSR